MDWNSLSNLIKEGEGQRLEFKESTFLKDNSEIAAQLTSFANRNGGRILVGVRDDGSIEGARFDKDGDSLHVLNVAHNKCSPQVDISFDHPGSKEGDVLVINVARRKGIPHAIIERTGAEITKRTYYIRSGNGKRLVDDSLLNFMFRSTEDPYIAHSLRICVWYEKNNLRFCPFESPKYFFYMLPFLQELKPQDIKFLVDGGSETIQSLLVEILPYALLHQLSWSFSQSWLVNIERKHGATSIHPVRMDIPSTIINKSEIPVTEMFVLSNLSLDTNTILTKFLLNFKIPTNTTLEIKIERGKTGESSALLLKNPMFDFQIKFDPHMWSVGLPDPIVPESSMDPLKLQETFAFTIIGSRFDGRFSFPDTEDPQFENHFKFGQTILDILQNEWDWDKEIERLNNKRIGAIDENIRKILEILRNK